MADQPLSGIKVLDLTNHITGAFCAKQFADYGADVIKIEKIGRGCHTRHMPPFIDDKPDLDSSLYFQYLNTNKKSITLNLKTKTGKIIFKNLISKADILIESFSPGVMLKLELNYEILEKINPRLVMASITNFGQTGPYRDYKASDLVEFAMGGAMSSTGLPQLNPINKARDACLFESGLQSWYAIMGVYMGTLRDNIGDYIDLSIMETQLAGCERRTSHLLTYQYTGDISLRVDPFTKIGIAPRMQRTKDGFINLVIGPSRFAKFMELIGQKDLLDDPSWNIFNMEKQAEAQKLFDICFSQKTRKEWASLFQNEGMICTPLNKPEDICNDEHWNDREFFREVNHPHFGTIKLPRGAVRVSPDWWQVHRSAPTLGQDNTEVYGSIGYSIPDQSLLKANAVI
ncbi:CoA transferase [bacterium]|nr:CoA transferase [bacterium]